MNQDATHWEQRLEHAALSDVGLRRQKNQDSFKDGRLSLMVATKAFGMGINKKDARFTVHYGIPASIESLYQEAGFVRRIYETAH